MFHHQQVENELPVHMLCDLLKTVGVVLMLFNSTWRPHHSSHLTTTRQLQNSIGINQETHRFVKKTCWTFTCFSSSVLSYLPRTWMLKGIRARSKSPLVTTAAESEKRRSPDL